ncbi:CLIP and Tryp_SPc domain-containing lethal (2) k05911 isoform 2-T2 [Glossina fuscipes fuscipes]
MFKKWKRSLFGILLIQLFVKTFGGNLKINMKNDTHSDMERSAAVNRMLLNSHTINKENATTIIATNKDYDKKIISLSKESVQEKESLKPINDFFSQKIFRNRTSRHIYYRPQYFYIQNVVAGRSHCATNQGLLGICVSFDNCKQQKVYKRNNRQQWPSITPREPCRSFDMFAREFIGVCCTFFDINREHMSHKKGNIPSTVEGNDLNVQQFDLNNVFPSAPNDDSAEVVELPDNFSHSTESFNDSSDNEEENNLVYDPIREDDWRKAPFYGVAHYPWAPQFVAFADIPQQWPPPLPTHPPALANWPPPIPTHPPNHHYPTHPPSSAQTMPNKDLSTTVITSGMKPSTNPAITITTTTKRPSYPNFPGYPHYPTYRPLTTTAVTTTSRPSSTGSNSSTLPSLPLKCGIRNAISPDQERIVGGSNASPHEFPWIVVLFKSGTQFCGGSLITNNHVLTAAHCVARMNSWDVAALTAHLGDYNIRTDFEVQHITRRIKRLVRHKGFDYNTLHNDIAILSLDEPVRFSHEIRPICLPTSTSQQTRSYSGQLAIVAGWGSLRESGPQPAILQKVHVPIWTNTECAQKYGRAAPGGIISSMICAGQATKDSCSGDSGGPLIVNEAGHYVQVGIVSWGIGCGKGQYPGVYTRITSLLPWIYKNLK